MEIDVLMCGYNEAPHIPAALESLRQQSVGPQSFRVIFVDNASKDETRKVVEENSRGLRLEYVYEARPGLNMARNAGYAHAKGEYVAHIDADAKADVRWIERILDVIGREGPDLLGGPYFPYYTTEKPQWFLDSYNSSYKGEKARYLSESEFLDGTNMIWRRTVVEQLGGFNAQVGLTERGLVRGDETTLIMAARRSMPAFKAFYDPAIVVYHLTRPETFSLWYWMRRSFTQGRQDYKIWNSGARRRPRLVRLAQFCGASTLIGAKGVGAFVQRNRASFPHWKNYWYERIMPEIYRLGGIWELVNQRTKSNAEG